jgi:GNAT superfamily N-acetyltransferase
MFNFDEISLKRLHEVDPQYLSEGLALLNRTQGLGLFAPSYLEAQMPNRYIVAAFWGERLIGLGKAEIIENFDYYLPFVSDVYAQLEGKKVGSFSTLSIVEDLQGKGIGQIIGRNRIEWLKSQNCDVAFGVSWVSGLKNTSDRVFERLGFKAIRKVEGFYEKSSLLDPFICPGCGDPPCTCAAILYKIDLRASL